MILKSNLTVPEIWLKISIFNLLLVAILGVIMRYKIGFEFPYFDQKNLQHAHSHFAFYGWVSHTLMVLMIAYIMQFSEQIQINKYYRLLRFNLLASYGMLFSFILFGYHLISVFFSVFAILVSYSFTWYFLKDFKPIQIKSGVSLWFRAALLAGVVSSFGTYALAYMMISHNITQKLYLLSVYFYLHFQYNGWFFFTIIGLTILLFRKYLHNFTVSRSVFWMFTLSCIPAYFLSALWLKIPIWVYILVVLAAFIQLASWFLLLRQFVNAYKRCKQFITPIVSLTLLILATAVSIKLVLQFGSVIPAVSQLAFGFRTIIIAYLHLVLLGIVSLFLVVYLFQQQFLHLSKHAIQAFILFILGVYLNELLLGIQGVASIFYFGLPYWNELLFAVSLLILVSVIYLLFSQKTCDSFNAQV